MTVTGSALARRQLGNRLRRLREQAGKTLIDVETAGIGSVSKIYRIEAGRSSVRPGDVRELCVLYASADDVLEPLLALARATKTVGWIEEFRDVLYSGVDLYFDLEATASTLNTYSSELIHGLLQTPGYHRAVTWGARPTTDLEVERFLTLLTRRQTTVLHRTHSTPPCKVTAVLGEAALTRIIGSLAITAAQTKHLKELNRRDHIAVRVLPWQVGAHPGLVYGDFTLLDFEKPDDPDILYLESPVSARYLEQEQHLTLYRRAWTILVEQSVPFEEYLQ